MVHTTLHVHVHKYIFFHNFFFMLDMQYVHLTWSVPLVRILVTCKYSKIMLLADISFVVKSLDIYTKIF